MKFKYWPKQFVITDNAYGDVIDFVFKLDEMSQTYTCEHHNVTDEFKLITTLQLVYMIKGISRYHKESKYIEEMFSNAVKKAIYDEQMKDILSL